MAKYDSVLKEALGEKPSEARTDALTFNVGFLSQELESLEAEFHKVLHTPFPWRSAVPVKSAGFDPFAAAVGYKASDWTGEAKFIANAADDLPLVNVAVAKETQKVDDFGVGYMVSVTELGAASMANRSLENDDAVAANEANERFLDKIAALGSTGLGCTGLLNSESKGCAINTPAANGDSSGTTWASKLALTDGTGGRKIVEDLCKLLSDVVSNSKGQVIPDRMVMDYAVSAILDSNLYSSLGYNTLTILEAFFAAQPYIKSRAQIVVWDYARTASTTGGSRIAAYKSDPRFLQFALPKEVDTLAPQYRNLAIVVGTYGRVAGMQIKQPLAMRYLDGTIAAP